MINNRLFPVLVVISCLILPGVISATHMVDAAGNPLVTNISAWPDDHFYLEGQTIQLNVSIWDENNGVVNTGQIRAVDLNGSTDIVVPVTSSFTGVSWLASTDGLQGTHIFEITYNDSNGDYLSSSMNIELIIGLSISPGDEITVLDMNEAVFNISKGQKVNSTGSLTIGGSAYPYFILEPETSYVSIEAEIAGEWKILSLEYPSTGVVLSYDFSLEYVLPPSINSGTINGRCVFSGSSYFDLAGTVAYFTINLLANEKSIVLIPQNTVVERNNLQENHVLSMEVQVPGFDIDPVELNLDLLSLVDGSLVKNLIMDLSLTDFSSQIPVIFTTDVAVGNYNISAELVDGNSGMNLANDSFQVTITDEFIVDNFYWDITGQSVQPGQIIQGYLVAREEDTFAGIESNLTIKVQESGEILFNSNTDANGYIQFTISIPNDLSQGNHDISFTLSPITGDNLHIETIITNEITILENTSILHQEIPYLTRNVEGWFNANVVDEQGLPVDTGNLSLTLNGELLYEGGTIANHLYTVPNNASRGINTISWYYIGQNGYNDSEVIFPMVLFSVPTFNNISSSIVETYPSQTVELRAQLLEETGDGVIGATVAVTHRDNWGNETQFQVVTDSQGWFIYDFNPDEEDTGIHTFTIEFNGYSEEYYLPITGNLVFEVSVSPPISLILNEQLIADENSTLEFQGRINEEIQLEIFENSNWNEIGLIMLDNNGNGLFEWTPSSTLKGEILLRVTYTNDQVTALFTLVINVRPEISVEAPEQPYIMNNEITILVTSDQVHDIWLDGAIWQSALSPGSRQFGVTFTETGNHLLEVKVSGNYIISTTQNLAIEVRKNYTVTVDLPTRIQKSANTIIDIIIEDIGDQSPIEGLDIELLLNNTLIASTTTSNLGIGSLNVTLSQGFYSVAVRVTPDELGVYLSKTVNLGSITVYSVPTIEIIDFTSVKGQMVDIEASITDGVDPVANNTVTFYLKEIDDSNTVKIGTSITDELGKAIISWNVTQDSGEYYLQVENSEEEFLDSVISSKSIEILETGPKILQASIAEYNSAKNEFLVTAVIEFPGGKGNVYLCTSGTNNQIGELQEEGSFWTLVIQLEKGAHALSIKAVDVNGIISWHDLGNVHAVTDLNLEPTPETPSDSNPLMNLIRDTVLSSLFLVPITGYLVYKKRKAIIDR
ncbi:MAG: hypothetical protein ACW99Q_06980 [Candidatus Kariarchaeaceae archaeon]